MDKIVLFEGKSGCEMVDYCPITVFTAHVGGEWDAAHVQEGTGFEITYTGQKNGFDLVLLSHSGSNPWARIPAQCITENGDGSYTAHFPWEKIKEAYGTRFGLLDDLRVIANTAEKMELRTFFVIPGTGQQADSGDGRWLVPDQGIAFLGDSIVQNVKHFEGDYNSLLNRTDCVNFGIGSQTTRECLARIGEIAQRSYHTLVLHVGINDIGKGRTTEEILGNVKKMLNIMREKHPEMDFVLVSVLPTSDRYFTNEQWKIAELNMAYAHLAAEQPHTAFADVYPAFLGADGYARAELTIDGLHPNHQGYLLLKDVLQRLL